MFEELERTGKNEGINHHGLFPHFLFHLYRQCVEEVMLYEVGSVAFQQIHIVNATDCKLVDDRGELIPSSVDKNALPVTETQEKLAQIVKITKFYQHE